MFRKSAVMMWRERDRRRLSSNDERTPPAYQPARAEGFPVSGELCPSSTSSDLVVGPVLGSSTHQSVSSFLRPELGAAFHIGGEFFKSKFWFQLLPGIVWMRRLNGQFPLPPNQVVIDQIVVGLFQRLHAGHAHPFHQPVLRGPEVPLHPPLGLWRMRRFSEPSIMRAAPSASRAPHLVTRKTLSRRPTRPSPIQLSLWLLP